SPALRVCVSLPAAGAAISTAALSVSSVATGSSVRTAAPFSFNHSTSTASEIDSASRGTSMRTLMNPSGSLRSFPVPLRTRPAGRARRLAGRALAEGAVDQLLLLLDVQRVVAGRRRGRRLARDEPEPRPLGQHALEPVPRIAPRAHVARLLLHPA